MTDTIHRVLRLLSLLEARPTWSGPELAERLAVAQRTVRRDVERLRELGYPVEAERGSGGGYRLGAGGRLPPLVLEDDEAVALVACLRMAALGGEDSVGEAALRALGKLDRVLPPQLRALASALDGATHALPVARPAVDWAVLSRLASAQQERHLVRFQYAKSDGSRAEREVEPARLVTQGRLWYLQGFDRNRDDWRVFRLDRMADLVVTTWRFAPRATPAMEQQDGFPIGRWACVGTVQFSVAGDAVAGRIPPMHREVLTDSDTGCTVRVGGAGWDDLAWHVLWVARDLASELVVVEPEELRTAMSKLAERAAGAVR